MKQSRGSRGSRGGRGGRGVGKGCGISEVVGVGRGRGKNHEDKNKNENTDSVQSDSSFFSNIILQSQHEKERKKNKETNKKAFTEDTALHEINNNKSSGNLSSF
jgi:hypothetical protein